MDEMVEWQPRLNGHEFEQTSGDSEEQGSTVEEIVSEKLGSLTSHRSSKRQSRI